MQPTTCSVSSPHNYYSCVHRLSSLCRAACREGHRRCLVNACRTINTAFFARRLSRYGSPQLIPDQHFYTRLSLSWYSSWS
ncbi:hypothetical protein BRADI_4g12044v3 [Brachypodium distachyon]|uniref:Uncharacterized protein n=1 Tax=Brachypodium distachyon TaxID=15368 RepID=A0A2K2CM85_BRADI|nr:hypothetical protein BRADI_4g12044v3 [Brachypodium distachyon]